MFRQPVIYNIQLIVHPSSNIRQLRWITSVRNIHTMSSIRTSCLHYLTPCENLVWTCIGFLMRNANTNSMVQNGCDLLKNPGRQTTCGKFRYDHNVINNMSKARLCHSLVYHRTESHLVLYYMLTKLNCQLLARHKGTLSLCDAQICQAISVMGMASVEVVS